MKFINKGEPVQVRQDDGSGRFKWEAVKTGGNIDLPEKVGTAYGFEKEIKATEGKIGETVVETKQIEEPKKPKKKEYREKLESIKGIGKRNARDIMIAFPKQSDLINAISSNAPMPFRDDVEKLLKKFPWETD